MPPHNPAALPPRRRSGVSIRGLGVAGPLASSFCNACETGQAGELLDTNFSFSFPIFYIYVNQKPHLKKIQNEKSEPRHHKQRKQKIPLNEDDTDPRPRLTILHAVPRSRAPMPGAISQAPPLAPSYASCHCKACHSRHSLGTAFGTASRGHLGGGAKGGREKKRKEKERWVIWLI